MNLLNRLFGGATHPLIRPEEYTAKYKDVKTPHTLLDVRTADEFRDGHIPSAVNISLQELEQKLTRIPKNKPVIIYCRSGNRSAHAARALLQAGYSEVYDLGGIIEWQRMGLPVKRKA